MATINDTTYLNSEMINDLWSDQKIDNSSSRYKVIAEQDLISGKVTVLFAETIKKTASLFFLILPTLSVLTVPTFIGIACGTFIQGVLFDVESLGDKYSYFDQIKNQIDAVSKLSLKEKGKWLLFDVLTNVTLKVAAFALFKRFGGIRSLFSFVVSSYYLSLFFNLAFAGMDRIIENHLDKKREQEYIKVIG